jgi:8-oxo-dGTP pyrophosphatase MutT (NUDIX family)
VSEEVEQVVAGVFGPEAIDTHWSARRRGSTPALEQVIARVWEEALRQAQAQGRELFAGPLCRLDEARVEDGRLRLFLSPTDYREYLGTNHNREEVRRLLGEREPEALANPLAVCAAVRTADGRLLIGRRSPRTMSHPGWWHVPAGHVDDRHVHDGRVDVVRAMLDEVVEETGVEESEVQSCVCIGLLRTRDTLKPELAFVVEVSCGQADLEARRHDDEHVQWHYLPAEPEAVRQFLQEHQGDLVPVGWGCLLEYGRMVFGDGWCEPGVPAPGASAPGY